MFSVQFGITERAESNIYLNLEKNNQFYWRTFTCDHKRFYLKSMYE